MLRSSTASTTTRRGRPRLEVAGHCRLGTGIHLADLLRPPRERGGWHPVHVRTTARRTADLARVFLPAAHSQGDDLLRLRLPRLGVAFPHLRGVLARSRPAVRRRGPSSNNVYVGLDSAGGVPPVRLCATCDRHRLHRHGHRRQQVALPGGQAQGDHPDDLHLRLPDLSRRQARQQRRDRQEHGDLRLDLRRRLGRRGRPRANTIATSTTLDIDDFYLLDTTGSAEHGFLGDRKVETLYPAGDGARRSGRPTRARPTTAGSARTPRTATRPTSRPRARATATPTPSASWPRRPVAIYGSRSRRSPAPTLQLVLPRIRIGRSYTGAGHADRPQPRTRSTQISSRRTRPARPGRNPRSTRWRRASSSTANGPVHHPARGRSPPHDGP